MCRHTIFLFRNLLPILANRYCVVDILVCLCVFLISGFVALQVLIDAHKGVRDFGTLFVDVLFCLFVGSVCIYSHFVCQAF